MTRRPQYPRLVEAVELEPGDRFYWAGQLVEVHRVTERPTAGTALVVNVGTDETGATVQRRLFYKPGDKVEAFKWSN